MKNKLFLGVTTAACGLLLLTGCGSSNKVVCSTTMKEAGKEIEYEIVGTLDDDNKISQVSVVFTFESTDDADTAYDNYKYMVERAKEEGEEFEMTVKKSGKKVTIDNYESFKEAIGYTKDEFIKELTSDQSEDSEMKFTCK